MPAKALNDLPLERLIGAPLSAATAAHVELSKANLAVVEALVAAGEKQFSFTRDDGNGPITTTVTVPTLSVVEIPNFSLESLVNEFTFEVSTIQEETNEKVGSLSGSIGVSGLLSGLLGANLEGGYESNKKTSSTNSQRGNLNITVTAVKQESQTAGMKTIMDAAIKSITSIEN